MQKYNANVIIPFVLNIIKYTKKGEKRMKKILSIILSLAMLLSTIIIPSAFIVSAEDVTTLNLTYYVDASVESSGDGLTAGTAFKTIAEAVAAAAAQENDTTVANATVYVTGTADFGETVAHKGMITIDGQSTGKLNGDPYVWCQGLTEVLAIKGPTTIQNIALSNVGVFATYGYELNFKNVDSTATTNQELFVGNNYQDGRGGDKLVIDGMSYNYGKGAKIHLTPVANNPATKTGGNTEVIFNNSSFMRLNINEGIYQGLVSFTFNGGSPAAYFQGAFLNGAPTFNDGLQFIFNNGLSKESFISTAFDTLEAAKGVWFVSGNADGKLIATDTAGVFNVEGDLTAVAKNASTNEVVNSSNGVLDLSKTPGTYNVTYEEPVVTELYVSETGSDDNSGATADKPLATINKAIEKFKGADGTIYLSGRVAFNGGVAHTGTITLDGQGSASLELTANKWYTGLYDVFEINGPTTFQNVTLDYTNNFGFVTTGYELKFGENVISNTLASNQGILIGSNPNYQRTTEKLVIDSFTNNTIYGRGVALYLTPVADNPTGKAIGSADVVFNGGSFGRIDIKSGTYNGLVSFTFNGLTKPAYYQGATELGDATFNDGLQFIFNNGLTKDYVLGTTVFDSIEAAKGVWFVSSAADGKLVATETAGKFNVEGDYLAVATNATTGDVVKSVDGVLDLSKKPGTYNVTYEKPPVTDAVVYVATTGSDVTGNGSEANPFATIAHAENWLNTSISEDAKKIIVMDSMDLTTATHSEMITIEGYDSNGDGATDTLLNIPANTSISGPTTLSFLNLGDDNRNAIFADGHELVLSSDVNILGVSNKTDIYVAPLSNGVNTPSKFVLNASSIAKDKLNLRLGAKTTYGIDVVIDTNSFISQFLIQSATYENNVNITINKPYSKSDATASKLAILGNPTINGNVQIVLNNGVDPQTYLFQETDALSDYNSLMNYEISGNKWFMYSDAVGGSLEVTETAGTFNVIGGSYAKAVNTATGAIEYSKNGKLTVDPGEYTVTYLKTVLSDEDKPFDITGDNKINSMDLTALTKALLKVLNITSFDANGDGESDIRDLIALKEKLALANVLEAELANTYKLLNNENKLTIGYIGGSITYGDSAKCIIEDGNVVSRDSGDINNSYVNRVSNWFKEKYPKATIETVNAGVSDTHSYLGLYRLEETLMNTNGHDMPDLVFIEFTTNDWDFHFGIDSIKAFAESLVLNVRSKNPYADIVILSTNVAGMNSGVVNAYKEVAYHYDIPFIDVGTPLRNAMVEATGSTNEAAGTFQYTVDNLHPSAAGYQIYFDTMLPVIEEALTGVGNTMYNYVENAIPTLCEDLILDPVAYDGNSDGVTYSEGCTTTPIAVNMHNTLLTELDTMNVVDEGITLPVGGTVSATFNGNYVGLLLKVTTDDINLQYQIDDGEWQEFVIDDNAVLKNHRYFHTNAFILASGLADGEHTITIKAVNSSTLAILG